MKTYWLVTEGDVVAAERTTEWDSEQSCLVYAEDAEKAIDLARRYDQGEIGVTDVLDEGIQVVCVAEVAG